ncbi:hypothetical protein L5515_005468 [Caenorhabditis briggsae]|uniref:Uncharacterized protein n=1 Tax=Caenorhabditis briggsae TaxID=6238 RepID=A0AAE9EQ91_CAEBR|nr:hypothetical protein L5515_005468 [Caenorhabditis briggsae]
MIIWNVLFHLAWLGLASADWASTQQACSNGNDMYQDKVLTIRNPDGNVTVWDVNETIELEQESGVLLISVAPNTTLELKYVDTEALSVVVGDGDWRYPYGKAIRVFYETRNFCDEEHTRGVRHIHFQEMNSLRDTSDELVLRYEHVCGPLTQRIPSLAITWKKDGNCPGPLSETNVVERDLIIGSYYLSRNIQVTENSIREGLQGSVAVMMTAKGMGNLTCKSLDNSIFRISDHTKTVELNGLTWILINFEAVKSGSTRFEIQGNSIYFLMNVTVVPAFEDQWKHSILQQVKLDENEPNFVNALVYEPTAKKFWEFRRSDSTMQNLTLKRDMKETDEIVFVFRGNKAPIELIITYGTNHQYSTWTYEMSNHAVTVPYKNLQNLNALGFSTGDQWITVHVPSLPAGQNLFTLHISPTDSPKPPSQSTPETQDSGKFEITEVSTYELKNANATEVVVPNAKGIYQIYRNGTDFRMVFMIGGNRNGLSARFADLKNNYLDWKLAPNQTKTQIVFKGGAGPHKLTLKNEGTGEKKAYDFEMFLGGKSFIHVD